MKNGAVFKALEGPDVYTVADVKRKDQVKKGI